MALNVWLKNFNVSNVLVNVVRDFRNNCWLSITLIQAFMGCTSFLVFR